MNGRQEEEWFNNGGNNLNLNQGKLPKPKRKRREITSDETEALSDLEEELNLDIEESDMAFENDSLDDEQLIELARILDDQEGKGKDYQQPLPRKRKRDHNKKMTSKQFGDFFIRNNHIFRKVYNPKTKKEEQREVCRLIQIKTIEQDIEDQTVEIELEYFYQKQLRTIKVYREELQKQKLSQLVKYGCDIYDSNVVAIQQFLRVQEDSAEYKHTHKQLGWSAYNEQEVFKHQKLLGSSDESTYNGSLLVESKGSFEEWERLMKREVLPYSALTLALIAGFASPVVAWIAKDFDLEVILLHIFGDSTMGKTTAARVFVSPFGAPTTKDGGTLLKWSGTANGIIGQLVNNAGVPLAIDEASMNRMKDFTEMIYTLAGGIEKARMTKTLSNRERRRWSGVLFSTAEHPLTEKTNHYTGLEVRITELGSVQWTTSAEHATRIKDGLLKNYGHAGERFIEYLIKQGKEVVGQRWKHWRKICLDAMKIKDHLSDRMADKFALLMAAGEFVQECFQWEMGLDGVLELLIEHDQKSAGQRNVGDGAYHQFIQLVTQHRSKFVMENRDEKGHEHWGRIRLRGGCKPEVEILTNVFRQKMGELGFDNYDVILKGWRDKGYLDNDANKYTRKRAGVQPKKSRQTYYCVTLPLSCIAILREENNTSQEQRSYENADVSYATRKKEFELPEGMNVLPDMNDL
ncbi:DUF927 domain-containing protein [Bacillus badius]|uniref:DUF927 domain-containing protein n=1 Tax=Bacillus badius TaxID=1455 RepID=UPI002E20E13C|nr:DUF927 domain-containing protein [Bacillus badius]